MAESNNLDDLIIPEPESEANRKKGLFVLLGLVVLLAIIGVVLTNIIMNPSDDNKTTKIKDEISQKIDTSKEFEAIKEKAKLDDDLAPLDEKDEIEKASIEKEKNFLSKDIIITGASVVGAGAAAAVAKNKRAVKEEDRDEILEEEPPAKPKKVERKREVVKKVVRKPKPKKRVRERVNYGGNIYIQVGSFSRGPTSSFINKIRRVGLKYRIKEVNGYRRVLVGPFRSVRDAQRVLPKVRAYISRNAFIKR